MNIILYTKTGCQDSKDVIDLFTLKKVKYEEREVLKNKDYFDELVFKSNQTKTPTVDIDGEIIADTDRYAVARFLKSKNYPGFY